MSVHIGIPETARKEIAHGLAVLLADSYSLYIKTHGFHWNVTGPRFNDLHAMFMAQYTELWMALDLIAERIRALGEFAPGSSGELARLTHVPEADGVPNADQMIRQLLDGHETLCRTAREALPAAEEANDQGTMDLLTQRLQLHEKTAWMLRSLLA